LGTAVKVLEVTGNFLSLLESVAKNLKEQDALKVSTLRTMLDAADSRLQSGLVYGMEKVVSITPDVAIPYLQRAAGACHSQGTGFIHFLVEQKKEKKSLSDLLQTVRHGARYLAPNRDAFNQFLSTYETTINNGLNDYHPLLPAVSAGVRAMHTSLMNNDNDADVFYDAKEPDDLGSLLELQGSIEIGDHYEELYHYEEVLSRDIEPGMSEWCG